MKKYVILLVAGLCVALFANVQDSDADPQTQTQRVNIKEAGFSVVVPMDGWDMHLDQNKGDEILFYLEHRSTRSVVLSTIRKDDRPLAEIGAEAKVAFQELGGTTIDIKMKKGPDRVVLTFEIKKKKAHGKGQLVIMRHPKKSGTVLGFVSFGEAKNFNIFGSVADAAAVSVKPL